MWGDMSDSKAVAAHTHTLDVVRDESSEVCQSRIRFSPHVPFAFMISTPSGLHETMHSRNVPLCMAGGPPVPCCIIPGPLNRRCAAGSNFNEKGTNT